MKSKLKIIIPIVIAVIAIIIAAFAINFKPDKTIDVSSLITTAQNYLHENKFEQAIAEFSKVIELDPMNVDAYIGLAQAYQGKGDIDKAVEILEKGISKTGDQRLKDMLGEILQPDKFNAEVSKSETSATEETTIETTTVTSKTEISKTSETTTISNEDREIENIRNEALEILSQFAPNKQTGEANSIIYSFVPIDDYEYYCYRCEYDDKGILRYETDIRLMFLDNKIDNQMLTANVVEYLENGFLSCTTLQGLKNGNFIALHDNGQEMFGRCFWYDDLKHSTLISHSNDRYEFKPDYVMDQTIDIYLNDGMINKIECNYINYNTSESLLLDENNLKWNFSNGSSLSGITPYEIGLPQGIDETIFNIFDEKIEADFYNRDDFINYRFTN